MSRPRRILVVEDDADIRTTLMEVLEDAGFVVHGASDGRMALAHLEHAAALPDLILLDLLMPVLDGAGFRAAQRSQPRLADIPVVIVSANDQVREAAERLGVQSFLSKPIALKDLLRVAHTYSLQS